MGSLKHVADLLLNVLNTAFKTAAVQCKQFPVFFAGGSVGVIPSNHLVYNRRIGAKLDLQVENYKSQMDVVSQFLLWLIGPWEMWQ